MRVLAILLLLLPSMAAADLTEHYQNGNQAYLDGDYPEAVEAYRKVLEGGVQHPDLYFNLANAYYRSGQRGLAVLFYEKALAMNPSDDAASSNLEIVKKELIDRVVMPEGGAVGEPLWHGFIRSLKLGWLTWTFLTFYLLVFAILIGRRLTRADSLRRLLFWINVPLITLALVFGLLLASRIYIQEKVHHGVVVSSTASLREGPERTAKELMQVHEGLKVRLLTEVGDFLRVRLANGVEGFVKTSQVGRI
jgi:tetratricopeptide (TPR) repeat protein